jgi:hypothetical protein
MRVSKSVLESFREVRCLSAIEQENYNAIVLLLKQEITHAFTTTQNAWSERGLNAFEQSNRDVELNVINQGHINRIRMIEIAWGVRIDRSLEQETVDDVLNQLRQEIPGILKWIQTCWDEDINASIVRGNYSGIVLPQLLETTANVEEAMRTMRSTRERREMRIAFLMGTHRRLGNNSVIQDLKPDVLRFLLTRLQI